MVGWENMGIKFKFQMGMGMGRECKWSHWNGRELVRIASTFEPRGVTAWGRAVIKMLSKHCV